MTEAYIKLGEIATYINGYAFKPKDRGREGLPIIRIQDLTGNSNDKGFYKGKYPSKIEINNGDILISWSASLGVYIWNSGRALLNQHIFKVVFDKKAIDRDYFVYAVQFSLNKMKQLTHGATMKHVVKKDFENVSIPYPSLTEQRKIACILDKLKKSMSKRLQELKKLDELIKARFVEMFGDPVINNKNIKNQKLGDVCFLKAGEFTSSKTISPVKTSINKYPCFGGNGIRGYVNNYTHQGNYSLIGRQGALCGNVKFATGKFRNTEHAILVSPKIEINSRWLFELLNLEKLNRFKSGAAQPGLAVKTLNEVTIPVPGLKLQNEFANFVQQVDKSKFENIVYLNKTLSSKILGQLGDAIRD